MSDSNNGEWSRPPGGPPPSDGADESPEIAWGYDEPTGPWWNESRSIIFVAGAAAIVALAIVAILLTTGGDSEGTDNTLLPPNSVSTSTTSEPPNTTSTEVALTIATTPTTADAAGDCPAGLDHVDECRGHGAGDRAGHGTGDERTGVDGAGRHDGGGRND